VDSQVYALRSGDECVAMLAIRPIVEKRTGGKYRYDVCKYSCEMSIRCSRGLALVMPSSDRCELSLKPFSAKGGGWAREFWLSFNTTEGVYVLGTHPRINAYSQGAF
jgi:hypothetical protein